MIATEEEAEPASVMGLEESERAKASTTQAALGHVEVRGVQPGVSLKDYF